MPAFRLVHGGRVPSGGRWAFSYRRAIAPSLSSGRGRAENVDLVMVRPGAEGFFEASRQAAGLESQRLAQALANRSGPAHGGVGRGQGFHLASQASAGSR